MTATLIRLAVGNRMSPLTAKVSPVSRFLTATPSVPGKGPDHRLQALLDRGRPGGGRADRQPQESGERGGRSKGQQESHGAMLMDTILPAGLREN